jgi:hypothetical protein
MYKVGDSVEYKGRKGTITQIVNIVDKVEYLVKFEDGTEERISLDS